MSSLPPLAPTTAKKGRIATPTVAAAAPADTASTRSAGKTSVRSAQQQPGSTSTTAPPVATSERGSVRSHTSVAPPGSQRDSTRSHQSLGGASAGGASQRSITSQVALEKLQMLEEMLLRERQAREEAESTLLAMQREKVSKEDANRQSQRAQRQLGDVMSALQTILVDPTDARAIRRLQSVVRGSPQAAAGSEDAAIRQDAKQPSKSFLDGIGQYERDRTVQAALLKKQGPL
jgi:hypothetical protein